MLDGWTDKVAGNEVLKFNASTTPRPSGPRLTRSASGAASSQLAYNNDGAGNKEFSEAMANQIKNTLGIDAEPKAYPTFDELRTVVTDRTHQDAVPHRLAGGLPVDAQLPRPIYATGAGSNDGDYSNKEFDKLIQEASAAEGDARYKLIGEAQAILLKDLPAIPLWYQNATAVTAKDLKGFVFNWKQKPDYYALTK